MEILVISRNDASDRRLFQSKQHERLGLSFDWIDAITPDKIDNYIDRRKMKKWERPLKDTEISCFLSHVLAWNYVFSRNQPCLILEDDACLSVKVPEFISFAKKLEFIDHLTLELHYKPKWLGNKIQISNNISVSKLFQDRAGAAAYILWPNGARILLNDFQNGGIGLADAFISANNKLRSFQVEPVMAMQSEVLSFRSNSKSKTYNFPSIIQSKGVFVNAENKYQYLGRRFNGQFKIAVRKLRGLFWGDLRVPNFDLSDFD